MIRKIGLAYYLLTAYVLLSIYNDIETFSLMERGVREWSFYIVAKMALIVGLIWLFRYFSQYLSYYRESQHIKTKILFFALLMFVYLICLVLTWPGNWNNVDEVLVFAYARNLKVWSTQGILSTLVVLWGLMLWPHAGAVIIFQVIVSSLVLANVLSNIYERVHNKRWCIPFCVLFISIPSIYFVLFPLRVWLFSVFFMWFLFELMLLIEKAQGKSKITNAMIAKCTAILALVCGYRTEIKFLMLLYPIILYFLLKASNGIHCCKKAFCSFLAITLFVVALNSLQNLYGGRVSKVHRVDPIITTLSMIVSQEDIAQEDLDIIDKVFNIEDLVEYADMVRPLQYKASAKSDYSTEDFNQFIKTATKLIAQHPKWYAKTRVITALYSTGYWEFYLNLPASEEYMIQMLNRFDLDIENLEYFRGENPLRYSIGSFLNGEIHSMNLYKLAWALWLPILIMGFTFSAVLLGNGKESIKYIVSVFICGIEAILVTLFEPGGFQMYYFPLYLCGWFILFLIAQEKLERREQCVRQDSLG